MKRESFFRGFVYAFAGLGQVVRTQRSFRVQLALALVALALGLTLRLGAAEMALLLLTISAVLAAEMVNTAVEAAVDMVSPDYHPLAKVAKDAAAGAVLVLATGALIVGALLFGPPLLRLWAN